MYVAPRKDCGRHAGSAADGANEFEATTGIEPV
jgi:hypothetical protein